MRQRVLHCIYDDVANPWVGGGGAVRIRELYARLAGEVELTLACGAYPGAARSEPLDTGRVVRLGSPGPYAWSRLTYSRAASALLRAGDFDAAVIDFSSYTLVGPPRGARVGVTVHHLASENVSLPAPARAVIRGVERRLLRHARLFSATSASSERAIAAVGPRAAEVAAVGAGVDDALLRIERREGDYLLAFGRLDVAHKGLDTVIDAASALMRTRPTLRLVIAGRGRDEERLRAMAASAGIAERTEIRSGVSAAERERLFGGALVGLMPSRFEGFGLGGLEMLAAGVPLVASNAGALPEVLRDGARLVPAGDAAALAREAGALVDDAAARAALSAAGRRVAERHGWTTAAQAHLEFLRRIAALPTSRPASRASSSVASR